MCGIFGFVAKAPASLSSVPEVAGALTCALRHRGPDDSGWAAFSAEGTLLGTETDHSALAERGAALLMGQTRLSIIDLSPLGHQPMFSEDGRYALVFNGEVYNYQELRKELEQCGIAFRSATDSEVLLQALIRWGESCLTRLTGMFAFAFFDTKEQTLLLARDFFGIKPLYFSDSAASFSFASDIPAMLRFPGASTKVQAQSVYSYLVHNKYDKGGDTFFRSIRQVPPACCLHVNLITGAVSELRKYWKPDLTRRSTLSFAEATAQLRTLFLDSLRMHLLADVPLGVALSGGIDSSAIACAVRYLQPEKELHTFSFLAKNSPVSEEQWINTVVQHTGAIPHTVEVTPHELMHDLDDMILRLGEPFGSTSIYAQYRVFRLARDNGFKVILEGQGADELLAGYFGYPGQRMASLLLQGNLSGAYKFLQAKSRWPGSTSADIIRRTIREFTPQGLLPLALKLAGRNPAPAWLDVDALAADGIVFTAFSELNAQFPHCRDKVRQTLAYQLTWEGLQMLLRHGDRNAMAFSIESRVPFLTKDIAEFCLSLPEEYLIDMAGRTKSIFREAMRGIVPDAILDRRDKIGFATPEQEWLLKLDDWVQDTLGKGDAVPYVRASYMLQEWNDIKSGKKPFDWRIWRCLNYIRWGQQFAIS